jgi:hypothetical protein
MNAKRSLQNRIRGWLPQEPFLTIKQVKVNSETKQPPPIIPAGYTLSATKVFGVFTIFWIIVYGLLFFNTPNLTRVPVSTFQAVAWIIAGLAVGTITGTILAKSQLRRLSKNYQFSTTGKDIVLIIVPIALFIIFSSILSWSTILLSIYSLGVSFQITKWMLFFNFEKKENMRLMQSWWGTEIYLIPKAPQSKTNFRGELLKFFLVAGIAGCVLTAVGYIAISLVLLSNSTSLGVVLSGLSIPLWTLTFYPILAIVNVFALVALYRGRKWGFYVLLTSSLAAFTANFAILGLRIESVAGLFGIAIIYILLRPKWNLLKTGWPNISKSRPLLLVILGIILLISSFILTSHVEDRLKSVPQGASIASDRFNTDQPKPDTEIQANLTTQERLHFEIIVVRTYPHQNVGSSVKFTISNQSLSSTEPTNVYFTNDKIGLPNDYYMFWSAPKNGTYYFTLNYNLSSRNVISYDITKGWNVYEPVQVTVYTPFLAQYMAPMMILAAAVLTASAVNPIRRILKKNHPQFDKA